VFSSIQTTNHGGRGSTGIGYLERIGQASGCQDNGFSGRTVSDDSINGLSDRIGIGCGTGDLKLIKVQTELANIGRALAHFESASTG